MYDVTFDVTRRDAAMDADDAQHGLAAEAPVSLPRWVVQTLANIARDLPHVLPSAVPDDAVTAYGRPGAVAALQRVLKPFEEEDLWPF